MFRFILRELAGWALIFLGLYLFFIAFSLLLTEPESRYILTSMPITFSAFVIFRGGIHLLKVAVAARICLEARNKMEEKKK